VNKRDGTKCVFMLSNKGLFYSSVNNYVVTSLATTVVNTMLQSSIKNDANEIF